MSVSDGDIPRSGAGYFGFSERFRPPGRVTFCTSKKSPKTRPGASPLGIPALRGPGIGSIALFYGTRVAKRAAFASLARSCGEHRRLVPLLWCALCGGLRFRSNPCSVGSRDRSRPRQIVGAEIWRLVASKQIKKADPTGRLAPFCILLCGQKYAVGD